MEDVEMKNEENTETWLVNRARQCLTTDPYASKAWLLTARTLFPKNFSIQFEAYGIAKSEQDTKEAARLLEEMFTEFPDKEKLACELQSISNAVQCKTQENQFLKGVFENIPPEMQSKMLLKIGEQNKDIIEQARLMVLVLNTFPHLIQQHGLKLVDSLLFTEKHAHLHSSINCYRKYLVCDIMPIILCYQKLDAPVKHIQKWLQKSIEFYISYIAQPPSKDINTPMLKSPDLMSPTKTSFAAGSFKKLGIIPGLTESESVIATPWNSLFELLELFGQKLGWNIGNLYRLKSREAQWQQLVAMQQRGDTKETVYCGSVLFLECLILHASRVESDQFAATSSGPGLHPPLVLVETCSRNTSSTSSEPKSKKMKLDAGASIHISKTVPASLEVVQNFTTAFRCWQLLHSKEPLEKELTKLLHYWKSENWPWLSNFETDCHLYQGEYREAIVKLENIKKSNANFSVLRADLQLASCYYCMGTYSKACEMLLNVIESLPHVTDSNQSQEEISPGSSHQLQLLSCTESDILPYCIKLIINCLKEKAFGHIETDDTAAGHMMVLLQYDWPKYESLFSSAIKVIKEKGIFSYNLFFNYFINIDMLEEFTWLKTQDGGKVNLNVLPVNVQTAIPQRTVTRGQQKGVKEDFKIHMEKQVRRTNENVEQLIRQFLTEQKQNLRLCLI